ncbi:MAG: response regulator [Candidatus Nealsonbacteria bacterium CG18_big_fil_WC_8_21_14_2_50_37_10]|uniref:Response regulator n=1 Tax=Candidatus Nealsonbacteria bacterium CG18_big_fil_WC_8_21_14_2_50_37_10 TaxID=1974717 RepID=A0A2H0FKE2_9BACT|nr:MAG: response regulator [Candidatus Nealsonbacteria bacterium CG18_big_fil_WC_8_21_14_2_50_37_10]
MKQILLVEDDPFLIDIYATKFKEEGFSVKVANDGEEGLRKLREGEGNEEKFDLLVLDIVLPHVDGWEILKEIKASEKLKNLKIVILSNLGQKGEVEKGVKLGATKYLIKAHYTPSEVVAEIKQLLK